MTTQNTLFFAHPGMAIPVRRVPVHHFKRGTSFDFELELVAVVAWTTAKLATTDTLPVGVSISCDAGGGFVVLGTDPTGGMEVGPLTTGQRMALTFRLTSTIDAAIRHRHVGIVIGTGT